MDEVSDKVHLPATTGSRERRARAWNLAIATMTVALMGVVFTLAEGTGDLVTLVLPATFLVVGWIVLRRAPAHVEGRLVLGCGLAWGFALAAPLEGSWVVPVGMMSTHLILRYPDGTLPSPRWNGFSRICTVMILVLTLVVSTSQEVKESGGPNPLYVPWAAALSPLLAALPICMVASFFSIFVRARRGSVVERTQIRWLSLAALAIVIIYVAALIASFGYDATHGFDSKTSTFFAPAYPLWLQALQSLALASFLLIPLAFGVAITRYHLYDIDRIVSRTTSYVVVSALVLATYGVVVSIALRVVPGSSNLAVAAATLSAAAIARPAVRRVQQVVDRRFDRTRYDHARIIEEFGNDVRQLVNPEGVSRHLVHAVQATLSPASTALWSRSST